MDSAKGNCTTRINKDKRPGDNKPVYEGLLTVPGTTDQYGFALFLGEDKNGRKYFAGPITQKPVNGKLDDQLSALLSTTALSAPDAADGQDRPYRIFLLPSQPKDNPDRKGEPPAFWGRAMLETGTEPLQVSVWEKDSRYNINPHVTKYLQGNTQYALARDKVEPVEDRSEGR